MVAAMVVVMVVVLVMPMVIPSLMCEPEIMVGTRMNGFGQRSNSESKDECFWHQVSKYGALKIVSEEEMENIIPI